jgi:hypothetical protein
MMSFHPLGIQEDVALISEIETDSAGLTVKEEMASTMDERGGCFIQFFYVFGYSIIKEVFCIRVF